MSSLEWQEYKLALVTLRRHSLFILMSEEYSDVIMHTLERHDPFTKVEMNQRSSCQHNTPASSPLLHYVILPLVLKWLGCECILEVCCLYQFCPPKIHTVSAYVVLGTADVRYVMNNFTNQQCYFGLPWLRFSYPDWGLSTMTEVFVPWLRFFYPDWGFSTLSEVFLPWLRFFYPDWGFPTLTEVFLPWLRFSYPDWGFPTLTEVFLLWLRFFLPRLRFSYLD